MSPNFFVTLACVFYCETPLTFTCYNFKIHHLPFKLSIFSEIVSKTYAYMLLYGRVCRVRIAKDQFIHYFSISFHSSKLLYFTKNWFWEKEILSFYPQKIYFVFLKQ